MKSQKKRLPPGGHGLGKNLPSEGNTSIVQLILVLGGSVREARSGKNRLKMKKTKDGTQEVHNSGLGYCGQGRNGFLGAQEDLPVAQASGNGTSSRQPRATRTFPNHGPNGLFTCRERRLTYGAANDLEKKHGDRKKNPLTRPHIKKVHETKGARASSERLRGGPRRFPGEEKNCARRGRT